MTISYENVEETMKRKRKKRKEKKRKEKKGKEKRRDALFKQQPGLKGEKTSSSCECRRMDSIFQSQVPDQVLLFQFALPLY